MQKLNPVLSEKIWGYEQWIASTHPNGMQKDFYDLCGGEYPLLVKVIQANDTLSIQVHPDDKNAVELEGEGNRGKTECWYVLDAVPDAKIVYGLNGGYESDVLAKAITDVTLEKYLTFVNVKKGDFIYIPSGTVHAIGGGLRLLEVQQSCDLTYRLYDWGRGREVHIEKGLKVINSDSMQPIEELEKNFSCKYFNLEKITIKGGWAMMASKIDKPDGVQLLFVISSNGAKIKLAGESGIEMKAEDIFAVEPGEKVTVEGDAEIMRIRVGEME